MGNTRPLTRAQQAAILAGPETNGNPQLVSLGEALDRWFTHLNASDRIGSPRTIAAYRYGTDRLVQHLSAGYLLTSVSQEDIEALLGDLKARGITPGGRALVYRPLRTFFRWAVSKGLVTTSPVEEVAAPKSKAQPVVFVTDDQWAAILATTSTRSRWAFRARRDRAILLMLATTGARLSEVADLRVGAVDTASSTFTVRGKGGKDRVLPLLPEPRAALDEYLRLERPRNAYSTSSDALWLAPRGLLTSNGIAQMLAERCVGARVTLPSAPRCAVGQTVRAANPAVRAMSSASSKPRPPSVRSER